MDNEFVKIMKRSQNAPKYLSVDRYKTSNLPDIFGSFDDLLNRALQSSPMNNNLSFFSGLSKGLGEGYAEGMQTGKEEGIEENLRAFMTVGKNQLMVTKEGDIFPFGSMDEIYKNDKYSPYIRKYLGEDKSREELAKPLQNDLNNMLIEKSKNLLLFEDDYTSDIITLGNDIAERKYKLNTYGEPLLNEQQYTDFYSKKAIELQSALDSIVDENDLDITTVSEDKLKQIRENNIRYKKEAKLIKEDIKRSKKEQKSSININTEKQSLKSEIDALMNKKGELIKKQKVIDAEIIKEIDIDTRDLLTEITNVYSKIEKSGLEDPYQIGKDSKLKTKDYTEQINSNKEIISSTKNLLNEAKDKLTFEQNSLNTANSELNVVNSEFANSKTSKSRVTVLKKKKDDLTKTISFANNEIINIHDDITKLSNKISTAENKVIVLNDKINEHDKIQKMIESYDKSGKKKDRGILLRKINTTSEEIDSILSGSLDFSTAQPPTLSKYFRADKTGRVPIFKSDNFSIYNTQNIRKIVKEAGIKDLSLSESLSKALSILPNDFIVVDKRTKPTTYKTMVEYIEIPKSMRYGTNELLLKEYSSKSSYKEDSDLKDHIDKLLRHGK